MSRTYMVNSGLVAIAATGLTPVFYVSVPSTADGNVFKIIPSVEVDASTPTIPSNSDIYFSLNKVTGTVGGGAAVTPNQIAGNVLASNLTWKSGSTALTGLTQSTEVWGRAIPYAAGSFREADEENTNALEIPLLPSTNYAFYMRVPVGPGAGSNCFIRLISYNAE